MKQPRVYLNRAQLAERIGVAADSISRYKLPPADAIIGPIDDDGTIPHGTVRGWLPATIDKWNAARPGRGARTDLATPNAKRPPAHKGPG